MSAAPNTATTAGGTVNHYDEADKAIHDAEDVLSLVSVLLNNSDVPIEGNFREALGTVVRLGEGRAKAALSSLEAMNRERCHG